MKLEPAIVRLELGYENARTASEVVARVNSSCASKGEESDVVDALSRGVRSGSVAKFEHGGDTFYFRK